MSTLATSPTAITNNKQDEISVQAPQLAQAPLLPRQSSERSHTHPTFPAHGSTGHQRIKKRIILCCDGTWQDGITVNQRWKYTNVLRLARAINHVDERYNPPIPQIVFYQSGIGSDGTGITQVLEGATGATLADKVQEAYAFLAHNYQPEDEIFLFGFSRGAYTARMVAAFVGEIGVLNKTDMDHFADIFVAYQKRGKATDDTKKEDIASWDEILKPWNQPTSRGKVRVESEDPKHFSVECVGVFDTVGSVGLPEEISLRPAIKTVFGFNDRILGPHVAHAYHALALNEKRKDFDCAKFEQTKIGQQKGQVLKQCWFTGCHSDVGGGYEYHDLSDLSLTWMAANVSDKLSLDIHYLFSLPSPVAPWGHQAPHNSAVGIYSIAATTHRQIPKADNPTTHETYHSSVLQQAMLDSNLVQTLNQNPTLIAPLLPLEDQLKATWKVSPERSKLYQSTLDASKNIANDPLEDDHTNLSKDALATTKHDETKHNKVVEAMKTVVSMGEHGEERLTHTKTITSESGETKYETNWLGKAVAESSMGNVLKAVLGDSTKSSTSTS